MNSRERVRQKKEKELYEEECRDIRASRLQKFVRILSGRWNILLRLKVGNAFAPAWCDSVSKITILEKIPGAEDEVDNLVLQKALSLHEVGHILFTNSSIWRRAVSHALANIIEDGRVELGISAMYPSARDYFFYLNDKLLNPEKNDLAAWLLHEAMKRTLLFNYDEKGAKKILGNKFDRAKELVNKAVTARTESEAVKFAVELQKLIGDVLPKEDLHFGSCGTSCRGLPSSSEKIKVIDVDVEGKGKVVSKSEAIQEKIKQEASKELYEESKQIKSEAGGWKGYGLVNDWTLGSHVSLTEAESQARRIARVLKALGTTGNGWVRNKRRGRIDMRKLYKISLRNGKVFKKHLQKEDTKELAVSLLVDCSGSMQEISGLAAKSSYAIARALEICGFDKEVVGFSDEVYPIVNFKQTVKNNKNKFKARYLGGTGMGKALGTILEPLLKRSARRKVIFIVTDGSPTDTEVFYPLLEKVKKKGVLLFGLNLDSWTNLTWKEKIEKAGGKVVNLKNVKELPQRVDLLLRKVLIKDYAVSVR